MKLTSFQNMMAEYKDMKKYEKKIPCAGEVTIEDLFLKLKDSKTAFGCPKLSDVTFVKGKSIVIGPNMWGDYLIVYKHSSSFYVSVQQEVIFLKKNEELKIENKLKCYDNPRKWYDTMFHSIDIYSLYEKVSEFVKIFVETGSAQYKDYVYKSGEVYSLNENTDPESKNYLLTDIDDRVVYDIDEIKQADSFVIYNHLTGDKMLTAVRKWGSFKHRYEFYRNEELYGSFEKQSVLSARIFLMSSLDGEITMRQCKFKAGTYYLVKAKDEVIGIIVSNLVGNSENPELDTCIMQVKNERFKPQIAALATMIMMHESSND